jgi:plasmid stabilization system protein ParE
MKVVFTPEAEEQAERCDTWWRENRTSSRDLFARELAETKMLLLETPNVGTVHAVLDGVPVRRVLLRKTRTHVYYVADLEADAVIIHSVWGAPKQWAPRFGE